MAKKKKAPKKAKMPNWEQERKKVNKWGYDKAEAFCKDLRLLGEALAKL